jgi:hypothetical protein
LRWWLTQAHGHVLLRIDDPEAQIHDKDKRTRAQHTDGPVLGYVTARLPCLVVVLVVVVVQAHSLFLSGGTGDKRCDEGDSGADEEAQSWKPTGLLQEGSFFLSGR